MATLRTRHIQHPESPEPNLTLNPDGTVELPVWAGGGAFGYVGTRYFTADGTFDKTDPLGTGDIGLRAVRVRLVGGGGGGSGSPATGAGEGHCGTSGSGAAYAESFIQSSALATLTTAAVGPGGPGGAGGNLNGVDGLPSSFGASVAANGGLGGFSQGAVSSASGYPGVSGQSVATGDLVINGGPSGIGFCVPGGFVLSAPAGSSALGSGAPGHERFGNLGADGLAAEGFGAGGCGSVNGPNQNARSGGGGFSGIVIVDCYV